MKKIKKWINYFKYKLFFIRQVEKAMGFKLHKKTKAYLLNYAVNIDDFFKEDERQKGRSTAYHIKLALSNAIVYTDGEMTNDLSNLTSLNMNRESFKKFREVREKLRKVGFQVCRMKDRNTNLWHY